MRVLECRGWARWVSGRLPGEGGGAVVLTESALGVGVGLVLLELAVVLLEVQSPSLFAAAHRKYYQRMSSKQLSKECRVGLGCGCPFCLIKVIYG